MEAGDTDESRTNLLKIDELKANPDAILKRLLLGNAREQIEIISVRTGAEYKGQLKTEEAESEEVQVASDLFLATVIKKSSTLRQSIAFLCCHGDCTKVMNKWHNFYEHLRVHTKEKPYQCSIGGCSSQFSQKSNFNKHLKFSHSNGKKKCANSIKKKKRCKKQWKPVKRHPHAGSDSPNTLSRDTYTMDCT